VNQVALLYDDQKLSDAERAKLFTLVADSVPPQQWRTITLAERTDLRTLVDRFFDYYPSGQYSAPLTVDAVVEIIRRYNDVSGISVPAGTTVRVPPLPMRAKGRFDFEREFRVYNADVQGYSAKQNAEVVALPTNRELAVPSSPGANPFRDATSTGIVIQLTEANINRLTPKTLPAGVIALSAVPAPGADPGSTDLVIGVVPMELLPTTPAACANPFATLEASPFRARQRARVESATTPDDDRLLRVAADTPLIVLDVGFVSHHGFKVRRVAEQVLQRLGAPRLAERIVAVEMYPVDAQAKQELAGTLNEYVASQPTLAEDSAEFKHRVEAAHRWIESSAGTVSLTGPRLDIPEVLLRALFFKHVTRGAVLNMSFRMQAPATAALLNEFAQDALSFSIAGVGNTVEPATPGWTPQDASMALPNFVTVTYGTEEGTVKAQFPEGSTGARVRLLAPGCGFEGIADEGSSLATPYVAATTWLRVLLDRLESGASPAGEVLARELVSATRPIHTLERPVESGGMFDPAMLIAFPRTRHFLLRRDGTEVELSSYTAEADCQLVSGPVTVRFTNPPPELLDTVATFALFRTDMGVFLWRRAIPASGFDRGSWKTLCEVKDFSFVANESSASPIRYPRGRMLDFINDVAFVTW
jgi:hypothetical protein